ncbi:MULTISPECIES: hypothetical protein [Sphingobacterium]|uniref:Uncharacterized protein n=1 Tax=Sphingobacterium thalpophilum TaxID=259 RepID=A0ACD5BXH7_9SPHI|nr:MULTISPECIES: hypothetical protein [Sphingobacterium]HAF32845.1 hypothetical protein [Sphingobacterium sp.]KKO92339.1 hypothetical protein AAW12_05300 [Sphingobacterium sp. Ag1]OJZ13330.1 MAG: hypothetical protein BGP15_16670 [Sphingobacterium sp. 40-24]QQT63721.1 hypothetical protein I6I97_08025 [Sphingobacterium multivorum]HAL51613.1 hypothetical protein [Sphingobacterium sp.]
MKNNSWIGLGIGTVSPVLAYILVRFTDLELHFLPEKPMAIYTIAVLVNLVLLRFAYRSGKDHLGKGIIASTFLAMILYLITHRITV